jgi:hypothetical protein
MQGGQGGGAKIIEVAGTCRGDDLGESLALQSDRNPLQSIFETLRVTLPPLPMTISDSISQPWILDRKPGDDTGWATHPQKPWAALLQYLLSTLCRGFDIMIVHC